MPAATDRLADMLSQHGPIDILIANAAIERRLPWQDAAPAHVEAHVAANFTSMLTLIRKLVPAMADRGWGRVVATGSVMAARPRAETVVYASIKAAQLTAIRAIGREVAARGVTMNVVSPGAIETEASDAALCRRRLPPRSGGENSRRPPGAAGRSRRRICVPVQRRGELHHRRGYSGRRRLDDRRCARLASWRGRMNGAPDISVFHEGRDKVGESPLWDQGRNALWWVDIEGKTIRCKERLDGPPDRLRRRRDARSAGARGGRRDRRRGSHGLVQPRRRYRRFAFACQRCDPVAGHAHE